MESIVMYLVPFSILNLCTTHFNCIMCTKLINEILHAIRIESEGILIYAIILHTAKPIFVGEIKKAGPIKIALGNQHCTARETYSSIYSSV